jgi:UPF0271 protein
MLTVDLNCDMGEGMANDAAIMPFITSANVACGFHAGNPIIMRETVLLALQHGVSVGAHPSYADKENLGRKAMALSEKEIYSLITQQLEALSIIVKECNTRLVHVKPHGALYNAAAISEDISSAIIQAVLDFDPSLTLFGLANSVTVRLAKSLGLNFKQEVFTDRTYQPDGLLTPRDQKNALISNSKDALQQVQQMVLDKAVTATNGDKISIQADTICIHGDGNHALEFARLIHRHLNASGILLKAK